MHWISDFVLLTLLGAAFAALYLQGRRFEGVEMSLARHERSITQLSIELGQHVERITALDKVAPVNLAAEVVSLSEQVARLRTTHQRFQGRFDKYIALEGDRDDDEPTDSRWRALMAAQRQGD